MQGPVGPGHRSNAPGPRWARASVGATWVGFTGVSGASANRGPVGPALRPTLRDGAMVGRAPPPSLAWLVEGLSISPRRNSAG
eukprot:799822-Prymnesium_polylepis.1